MTLIVRERWKWLRWDYELMLLRMLKVNRGGLEKYYSNIFSYVASRNFGPRNGDVRELREYILLCCHIYTILEIRRLVNLIPSLEAITLRISFIGPFPARDFPFCPPVTCWTCSARSPCKTAIDASDSCQIFFSSVLYVSKPQENIVSLYSGGNPVGL